MALSTFNGPIVAGTDSIHTLTIGGTPTGGHILLRHYAKSALVAWSATNATLLANLNTALDAIFPGEAVVAAAGSLTAGIGTITITHSGANWGLRPVNGFSVVNYLTGTAPTLALAKTTPGVLPTGYGRGLGSLLTDSDNGLLYINEGTAAAPALRGVIPAVALLFSTLNIAANQNPLTVPVSGAGVNLVRMPYAGIIVGLSANLSAAGAGSAIRFRASKNGTTQAASEVSVAAGGALGGQVNGLSIAFAVGDDIGALAYTDGSWTSTTVDALVTVFVRPTSLT